MMYALYQLVRVSRHCAVSLVGVVALIAVFYFAYDTYHAHADRLLYVSDLITSSAPGAPANHRFLFTTVNAIPPSGSIRIEFGEDMVMPPTFGVADIDLMVATSATTSLSSFVQRPLATVADAVNDGVTLSHGTDSSIVITLNSTTGIEAGATVRIHFGTNATFPTQGTEQFINQENPGPVVHYLFTYNASNQQIDFGLAANYVIPTVTVGADFSDNEPPVLFNVKPELDEMLPGTTESVVFSFNADEPAFCKYSTVASTSYAAMPFTMIGDFSVEPTEYQSQEIFVDVEQEYEFFVLCEDVRGNLQTEETIIRFSIGVVQLGPGPTGSEGDLTFLDPPDPDPSGPTTGSGSASGSGSGSGSSGAGSGGGSGGGSAGGQGDVVGGGPEGGPFVPRSNITVSGFAIPNAEVRILRDGVVAQNVRPGSDGSFSARITELERGTYTIGMYAVDPLGRNSRTYSTTIAVRAGTESAISNVVIPPTVSVSETEVTPGEPIVVFGYAPPNATVITYLLRAQGQHLSSAEQTSTTATAAGVWQQELSTTGLGVDTYRVQAVARIASPAVTSAHSQPVLVGLGRPPEGELCPRADINSDGRVNLTDFSILLFNWGTSEPSADINLDGTVDITDFSILLFCWTG